MGIKRDIGDLTYWIRKTFTIKNGYGWHATITDKDGNEGNGFDKKSHLKSIRKALKEIKGL